MKIISWNINGIRAITKKDAFSWLKDEKCDILCFQEIKALKEQIPESIYELGFKDSFVNSAKRKGYSGTMTLSNIKFDKTEINEKIDYDFEGRILEHYFDDIVLFNVYFPNGQQGDERLEFKMKFYDLFLKYCKDLKKENKKIIICGDVNTAHKEIDLKNPKANEKTSGFLPCERAWIDKLLENGFIDTFRHINGDVKDVYSWWSYRSAARVRNTGWRIDYFFISEDLLPKLKNAFVLNEIMGSDHCPVGIEIDV